MTANLLNLKLDSSFCIRSMQCLIDDSKPAELEAELAALENELNSIREMDEPDMTDV